MNERILGLIKGDLEDFDRLLRKMYQIPPEKRTTSTEETISFFDGAKWALQQILRQMKEGE